MANNPYYRDGKSFIPYVRPIPWNPVAGVFDGPQNCLRFSQEWTPLIAGALAVLARPETYDTGGDLPRLQELVEEGTKLMQAMAAATYSTCTDRPEGFWELAWDFIASDGGFVPLSGPSGPWGVWEAGIGWKSTVQYESALGKWRRMLSISKTFEHSNWVTFMNSYYSQQVELAPFNGVHRYMSMEAYNALYQELSTYITCGTDMLNAAFWGGNNEGAQCNIIVVQGESGLANGESDLAGTSATVTSTAVYGNGMNNGWA